MEEHRLKVYENKTPEKIHEPKKYELTKYLQNFFTVVPHSAHSGPLDWRAS
jgi:hypothetical protein